MILGHTEAEIMQVVRENGGASVITALWQRLINKGYSLSQSGVCVAVARLEKEGELHQVKIGNRKLAAMPHVSSDDPYLLKILEKDEVYMCNARAGRFGAMTEDFTQSITILGITGNTTIGGNL